MDPSDACGTHVLTCRCSPTPDLRVARRPGAYSEGNAWVKRGSHRYKPPPSPQRVAFIRTPSAPSIPARNQSYGYEDTTTGELLQQPPTKQVITGMGR